MKHGAALSTILFDLDGTLVDTVRTTAAAFSEIRRRRGLAPIEHELIKPYVSRGGVELTRYALGEGLVDADADLQLFRQILAEIGPCHDEIYSGVIDALRALTEKGIVLGIVTNKPQGLSQQLLNGLKLSHYFALVVGGDMAPRKKPDPSHIQVALDKLEVSATNAIFIGDSEIDAEAAERSGLPFVHFSRGYCGAELLASPEYPRFAEYSDLIPLLSNLNGRQWEARITL